MPGPIRLNKILKELNISLDRAVEFLGSKDIKIDARPTTKVDQKIYDLLSTEFEAYKSEKNVLDKINIQKRKENEAKELLDQKDELQVSENKKDETQTLNDVKKEKENNPDQIKKFSDIVNNAGYASPVRKTRGQDIMAACGQLVGKVNDKTRRKERNRVKNLIKVQ